MTGIASQPPLLRADTLDGLFEARVACSPRDVAYRQFEATSGAWREYCWSEIYARSLLWRSALNRNGLRPGDRVALQLRNSIEWVCFDQAALSLGLILVPLFLDNAVATTRQMIEDSGARLLLIETAERWETLRGDEKGLPSVERVVCLNAAEGVRDDRLVALGAWLPEETDPGVPQRAASPGAIATIVYTSGTTGKPRGAMLSHFNLLSVAEAALERHSIRRSDLLLSYLPLAHIFERVLGYYIPMMAGAQVQFARAAAELPRDLIAARPTVLLVVPHILERLRGRIEDRAAHIPAGRLLLWRTISCGLAAYETARDGRRDGLPARLGWAVLRRAVADRVLSVLGGRLRVVVSGGAALAPETARFFLGLGLPLIEGYGLTESSSAVSGARLGRYVPGSSGPPLKGIKIRIAEDGEILVRSPGTMQSYWMNEEATAKALAGGWLHTGDVGELRQGQLCVIRRTGDILMLSTGEKVDAAFMEAAIERDRLFAQVLVAGRNYPHPAALIVLDRGLWQSLAKRLRLKADDPAALASASALAEVRRRLDQLLADFPRYAQIRAVHLTLRPWTVEDGLLTSTLKPKRPAIERHFAAEIEALARRS